MAGGPVKEHGCRAGGARHPLRTRSLSPGRRRVHRTVSSPWVNTSCTGIARRPALHTETDTHTHIHCQTPTHIRSSKCRHWFRHVFVRYGVPCDVGAVAAGMVSAWILPRIQRCCRKHMDRCRLRVHFTARSGFAFVKTLLVQMIPCANSVMSAPARSPRAKISRDALTVCAEDRRTHAVSATGGRRSMGICPSRIFLESGALGSGRTIAAASPSGATAGNFTGGRQRRCFV